MTVAGRATVGGTRISAGLDISGLVPIIQELFVAGLAMSTQSIYWSGNSRYQKYCYQYDLQPYPDSCTAYSMIIPLGGWRQVRLNVIYPL